MCLTHITTPSSERVNTVQKAFRMTVSSLLALCLAIAGLSAVDSSAVGKALVASAVASATDADSAAVVKSAQGTLDVPRNLTERVKAVVGSNTVSIALPGAQSASRATRLANGTIAYAGSGESFNTVIPTSSGVQMLTTVKSASAPTQYAYAMTLPRGGQVQVLGTGQAVITDGAGKTLATVAAPWAVDANGAKVPTRFKTDGQTLTQVVDHTSGRYAYPVVADPSISFGWSIYLRYSKQEVKSLRQQGVIFAYAALWNEACAKLPGYARAGCTATLAVVFAAISQTFQAAANENKCVEIKFDYSGGLDGWRRYIC